MPSAISHMHSWHMYACYVFYIYAASINLLHCIAYIIYLQCIIINLS